MRTSFACLTALMVVALDPPVHADPPAPVANSAGDALVAPAPNSPTFSTSDFAIPEKCT